MKKEIQLQCVTVEDLQSSDPLTRLLAEKTMSYNAGVLAGIEWANSNLDKFPLKDSIGE